MGHLKRSADRFIKRFSGTFIKRWPGRARNPGDFRGAGDFILATTRGLNFADEMNILVENAPSLFHPHVL